MTTTGPKSSTPNAITAFRVGPVITTLAAVIGAAIMFGIGVLVGRVGASVLGLHAGARTGVMLGVGGVFGVVSAVSSARRHLPKR